MPTLCTGFRSNSVGDSEEAVLALVAFDGGRRAQLAREPRTASQVPWLCGAPKSKSGATAESGRKGDASGGSPGPSASSDRLAGRGSPAQQLSQHEPWREVGREPGNLKAPHRAPRARPRLSRCATWRDRSCSPLQRAARRAWSSGALAVSTLVQWSSPCSLVIHLKKEIRL